MSRSEVVKRNAELRTALLAHETSVDEWVRVASLLVDSVIRVQFGSVRGTVVEEDLRQAALYELVRCAPRIARMASDFTPDSVFRVLFSVVKFTMIRELERLGRGAVPKDLSVDLDVEPYATPNVDPRYVRPEPSELILGASASVMGTQPVRYVAIQLLRGRSVSPEVLRAFWAVNTLRASQVYSAATVEARSALVRSCLSGSPAT